MIHRSSLLAQAQWQELLILLVQTTRDAATTFSRACSTTAFPFSAASARATIGAATVTATTTATATTIVLLYTFLWLQGNLDSHTALKHYLDRILRHIDRRDLAGTTWCTEESPDLRHALLGLDIIVVFVGEAAHETTADTRDFRGVERKPLFLRHLNRDNTEFRDPGTTAECFATYAHTSLQLGLIASPNLA